MNEWWEMIKQTAQTTGGIVILILAVAAIAAAVIFLFWRGLKHFIKALIWLFWTLLVLGAIGAGLYLWTVRQDPVRAKRLREVTIESVRAQAEKLKREGRGNAAQPLDRAADVLEEEWLDE